MVPVLHTTLGPMSLQEIGMMLSHEHVFTDLRTEADPSFGIADKRDVVTTRFPALLAAKKAGLDVIVECTPVGVARNAAYLLAVSMAAQYPLVVPTGVYREPWLPRWVREAEEASLEAWMRGELDGNIGGTGVRAAWIKLSAGDGGMTEQEEKVLRAAARAGAATGAVIGSHTIRGTTVRHQLQVLEESGYRADRFIWIHTQAEPDFALHLEMAKRGVWISYDNIGASGKDDWYVDMLLRMLEAGFTDQLLLSHDRGWYDPAKPHGGIPEPFTYLPERFLPKLRASGVDEATIRRLMRDNPFRAFSR